MSLVSPGHTARPETGSSVAPVMAITGLPASAASERPAHRGNEAQHVGASDSVALRGGQRDQQARDGERASFLKALFQHERQEFFPGAMNPATPIRERR